MVAGPIPYLVSRYMSKQSAPTAEQFAEWRKSVVGEWFFDKALGAYLAELDREWEAAIELPDKELLKRRLILSTQRFHMNLIRELEYEGICDELGVELPS